VVAPACLTLWAHHPLLAHGRRPDGATLVAVLLVIGILVLGALVAFLWWYFRPRPASAMEDVLLQDYELAFIEPRGGSAPVATSGAGAAGAERPPPATSSPSPLSSPPPAAAFTPFWKLRRQQQRSTSGDAAGDDSSATTALTASVSLEVAAAADAARPVPGRRTRTPGGSASSRSLFAPDFQSSQDGISPVEDHGL